MPADNSNRTPQVTFVAKDATEITCSFCFRKMAIKTDVPRATNACPGCGGRNDVFVRT